MSRIQYDQSKQAMVDMSKDSDNRRLLPKKTDHDIGNKLWKNVVPWHAYKIQLNIESY